MPALTQPPPAVKMTTVYSRSAGIVRWRSCLDDDATHVEVAASNICMAVNAQTCRTIGRALARPAS